MNNEKVQINLAPGQTSAEVVIRQGEAAPQLKPLPPVKIDILGSVGTVAEFLAKRINAGQFSQDRCNIQVNRERIIIALTINEDDPYRSGTVVSKLQFNPRFLSFGINDDKVWTPSELGMFFKMNRSFFPDRQVNMQLVSQLMNFSGTVNASIERDINHNGSYTDKFAQVVNSNLPPSFSLRVPIFKGMPPQTLEVETFARIDGRDIQLVLISPGAQASLEDIRDNVIDQEISAIRAIAPEIAIFEV